MAMLSASIWVRISPKTVDFVTRNKVSPLNNKNSTLRPVPCTPINQLKATKGTCNAFQLIKVIARLHISILKALDIIKPRFEPQLFWEFSTASNNDIKLVISLQLVTTLLVLKIIFDIIIARIPCVFVAFESINRFILTT